MRLLYALILITGFDLPQWWYIAAFALWLAGILATYRENLSFLWGNLKTWWQDFTNAPPPPSPHLAAAEERRRKYEATTRAIYQAAESRHDLRDLEK